MTAVLEDFDDIPGVISFPSPADPVCTSCGKSFEIEEGRRGRKPTKCSDCRSKRTTRAGTGSAARNSAAHVRKANAAADVLCNANVAVLTALIALQLPTTANSFSASQDAFREQAVSALMLDEKLCDRILSMGSTSGAAALFAAYAMMMGTVSIVAVSEIRMRKEENPDDRILPFPLPFGR